MYRLPGKDRIAAGSESQHSSAFKRTNKSFLKCILAGGRKAAPLIAQAAKIIKKPFASFKSQVLDVTDKKDEYNSKKGFKKAIYFIKLAGYSLKSRDVRRKSVAYIAPVLAIAVLAGSLYAYSSSSYALEVTYNGSVVAYVEDEAVFNNALIQIETKIADEEVRSSMDTSASFRLVKVPSEKVANKDNINGIILNTFTPALTQANGLFIDDTFIAASANADDINMVLNSVLDSYRTGGAENIAFNNNVSIVSGYYSCDDVKSADEIKTILNTPVTRQEIYITTAGETLSSIAQAVSCDVGRISELNAGMGEAPSEGSSVIVEVPRLPYSVKVIKSESYEQTIAYDTVETEDDSLAAGTRKVTVDGADGKSIITEEIIFVDGVEVSRSQVSAQVIAQPVAEQISVGTKEVVKEQSRSLAGMSVLGDMAYPVEIVDRLYISSYYGDDRGHKGWDFAAPEGTKIFAAADGVVKNVNGVGSDYGLHFMIDHGNGICTLYAHCSSINVTEGQAVSCGEIIAEVGNTGRSTGNHLHFEIRENGTAIDPAPYLNAIR